MAKKENNEVVEVTEVAETTEVKETKKTAKKTTKAKADPQPEEEGRSTPRLTKFVLIVVTCL